MKYYIIAGEASGDLHGSNLIKELQRRDGGAVIRCWGGDQMQATGATLVKHYRDLAFMGFAEVIKNLPSILKNLKFCKQDISKFAPDVIVFIDYPGFNLRIAKWAKENGYNTVFYISPQLWAWKENRVKSIKKYIDRMIVILPFEKEFYEKWDYKVYYVGHPLVKVIDDYHEAHPLLRPNENVIALLPGSRLQEIKTKLPVMLEATKNFPGYEFVVAKAPAVDSAFYDSFLQQFPNVRTVVNSTYSILLQSAAALVTSGTATLETALCSVPEIVCYKAGSVSYEIGRRLINLKFISLVNIIMNKEVIKELIQNELTPENITLELNKILHDDAYRKRILADYQALKALLSKGGDASSNAAEIIYEFVATKSLPEKQLNDNDNDGNQE